MSAATATRDARAVLLELQWSGLEQECPRCGWRKDEGHHPTCDLAAALAEPEAPELLIPPAVSALGVSLEHILEQVQASGDGRTCALCRHAGFGHHADWCAVGILLAELPGREGSAFLSTRRPARDIPKHWPRPFFHAEKIDVGMTNKTMAELEGSGQTVVVRLKHVRFYNLIGGAQREYAVADLALNGDELVLLTGGPTWSAGFVTEEERKDARRHATTKAKD